MRRIESTATPLYAVRHFAKAANTLIGSYLITCLTLAGGATAAWVGHFLRAGVDCFSRVPKTRPKLELWLLLPT